MVNETAGKVVDSGFVKASVNFLLKSSVVLATPVIAAALDAAAASLENILYALSATDILN